MPILFAHLKSDQIRIYSLVLTAVGIHHITQKTDKGWQLVVPDASRQAALAAVRRYLEENPPHAEKTGHRPDALSAGLGPALLMAALLVAVHMAVDHSGSDTTYTTVFGASAGRIQAGELYRCATALLLHADWRHLAANVAGILIFATPVSAQAGWGIGPLLILAAGTLGNWLNGLWHPATHLSIGASTAVFAAVGLLTGMAVVRQRRHQPQKKLAWAPLGAGLALLAMTGAAPQSDVLAHGFGFVTGILMGAGTATVAERPAPPGWQFSAAALAAIWLIGSWLAGYGSMP